MQGRLPRSLLAFAVVALTIAACRSASVPEDAVYACNDGKCPEPLVCRENFCVSPQASTAADACTPFTCELLGKNCGSLSDGCGGTLECGSCTGSASCGGGGVTNVCGCTPIPDDTVCADAGRACGSMYFSDGCNPPRQVTCGSCGGSEVCSAGSCCTPETDSEVCATHNVTCGTQTLVDRCGQHRTINCGGCDAGFNCIEEDTGRTCVACQPESNFDFCLRQGFTCGTANGVDNCGIARSNVDCDQAHGDGGCASDAGCGQTGLANLCECQPMLGGCSRDDQCCTGQCGPASLCCLPQGAICNDDSDCCNGWCAYAGSNGKCTGPDGGL